MAAVNEKLAESLEALDAAARGGVVRASSLSRTHRERLLKNGFLREVVKGWLLINNPAETPGSSISWYASYWPFVTRYLAERFGTEYCLSPEASLLRHVQSSLVPRQVVVATTRGSNQVVRLPFDTSLVIYQSSAGLPGPRVEQDGLLLLDLPTAFARISPAFFRSHPQDVEIALRVAGGPGPLLRPLLAEGQTAAAGRIAGALGFLGDTAGQNQIVQAMRTAGFAVRITNPFDRTTPLLPPGARVTAPQAARVTALWAALRDEVARRFPDPPGLPADPGVYLAAVDDRYESDAYNSLSIEGYQVTPELIARVRADIWSPDTSSPDSHERDALAARGYFQAFQAVRESLAAVIQGAAASETVERDHPGWYQEMFAPSVQAGLLPITALAGYRSTPVYVRGSRHAPPAARAVPDSLEAFFDALRTEAHPGVRAVLGHFLFVYIHPYPDGNGRMGRFLMNVLLAAGGYPWTVIRLSRRKQYLETLEAASVQQEIAPFADFVREEMEATPEIWN